MDSRDRDCDGLRVRILAPADLDIGRRIFYAITEGKLMAWRRIGKTRSGAVRASWGDCAAVQVTRAGFKFSPTVGEIVIEGNRFGVNVWADEGSRRVGFAFVERGPGDQAFGVVRKPAGDGSVYVSIKRVIEELGLEEVVGQAWTLSWNKREGMWVADFGKRSNVEAPRLQRRGNGRPEVFQLKGE